MSFFGVPGVLAVDPLNSEPESRWTSVRTEDYPLIHGVLDRDSAHSAVTFTTGGLAKAWKAAGRLAEAVSPLWKITR